MKKTILTLALAIIGKAGCAQSKSFEGKIIYDVVSGKKREQSTQTYYFKHDKIRVENTNYGSTQILNCDEDWFFSNVKNSVMYNNLPSNSQISKLVYYEDFKTISGYTCQRVTFSIKSDPNGDLELKYDAYVTKDIVANLDCNKLGFTMLEYSMETISAYYKNKEKCVLQNLSAETLSDELFIPQIPNGLKAQDLRSRITIENGKIQKGNNLIGSYSKQLLSGSYSDGGTSIYKITNANGIFVAKIMLTTPTITSSEAIKALLYKGSDELSTAAPLKTFEDNFDKRVDHIRDKAIKWLIENGYL
ncbi:MAG: hypothetical protein ACOVLD_02410 [Bacteroidia bacterium]